MKKNFKRAAKLFLVILMGTVIFTVMCVSPIYAGPRELVIKHWGPELIGGSRDSNPAAVGHNCGNPAKDGFGNVIGWEVLQDADNQETMFNHMVYGCDQSLEVGDYIFEVRMKVSNMDEAYSSRFFNIDIYCANHASYLGNLSVTRTVINNTVTDENGYGIYRLAFEVDSKHSGELLEGRIHFSNESDAIITDCSYIRLDYSVEMEDISIPVSENVTENAVYEDGTVTTDPAKTGYIFTGYRNNKLPEGQLYMKMIFGLGNSLEEMKNSNNILRFEVLDVSGESPVVKESQVFTGRDFKFKDGTVWTPDQLYTLVMPFKVMEDMTGMDLEFRVHSYGNNGGRQASLIFLVKNLLISDNPDIYDDPNKPVPVTYTFNQNTVTGDLLKSGMSYSVYKDSDISFQRELYKITVDSQGKFTVTTEVGYFILTETGKNTAYIYFTVDDRETANFSIIAAVWEDKDIFTPPEDFDPNDIKEIPEPAEQNKMSNGQNQINQNAARAEIDNSENQEQIDKNTDISGFSQKQKDITENESGIQYPGGNQINNAANNIVSNVKPAGKVPSAKMAQNSGAYFVFCFIAGILAFIVSGAGVLIGIRARNKKGV